MMTIPAAADAALDRALRGTPLAVYRYLLDELDMREWGEAKRLAMCSALGIGKTAAAEAMELLVRRGYIELDEDTRAGTGQARRYRLYYRRQPGEDESNSGSATASSGQSRSPQVPL
jgi:predicted ArsR family transcriptional regulator